MRVASDMRSRRSLLAPVVLVVAACGGGGTHHGGSTDGFTADAAVAGPGAQAGRASAEGGAGGSSAAAGSGPTAAAGAGSGALPPESPLPDAGAAPNAADPCELPPELGGPDRRALDRLGLFGPGAVVEGVLLSGSEIEERGFARVALEHVWFGWAFLAGIEVLVPMTAETYADLGTGARVILGIGGNGQPPSASTLMTDVPLWEPLTAVIRAEHACSAAPLVGYQPWKASAVVVAKIVAQDSARTSFEVVETLAGDLPAQFQTNWPAEYELPYFGVSDTEYIVSVEWYDDSFGLVAIVDMRPNDAAQRDEVEHALARWGDPNSPERGYLARLTRAAEAALTTRTAWLYNQAELVATLEISGKTPKCCNTLDGVFLAGDVREVFKGTAPDAPLITFQDGRFPDHACGDRFIYALSPVATASEDAQAFACGDQPSGFSYHGATASQFAHRMPDTPDNAEAVARWIASDPPLYRLHSAVQVAAPELFAAPSTAAMWSVPLEPEAALAAGYLIMVTVERVVEHADGHEVVLSTQFTPWPLQQVQPSELKLFLADADPRLLEAGRSWLAVVASVNDYLLSESTRAAVIAAGHAFLVPGLLLPVRDELSTPQPGSAGTVTCPSSTRYGSLRKSAGHGPTDCSTGSRWSRWTPPRTCPAWRPAARDGSGRPSISP